MSGTLDVIKGRIKEALGALTGNNTLREAGRSDQVVGKAKQAAHTALGKVKVAARKSVDAAKETAKQSVHEAEDVAQKSVDQAKGTAMHICDVNSTSY